MRELYGAPPVDLGRIDLSPTEMMFWMYCPIKLPHQVSFLPPNLRQFSLLVDMAWIDCDKRRWNESYVYITAKTLWVCKESPGNRPGWHSDGFMTDDLNYIWSDRNGTEFWTPSCRYTFSQHHHASLTQMDQSASLGPVKTYPDKHLLRLDESVIHRVAEQTPGIRTFVKISISKDRYDLEGNSINHAFPSWTYVPRGIERNHTTSEDK